MTGGGGATGRGTGTARERAMQAVEYYNSTVLRARVGAGLLACSHNHHAQRSPPSVQDALYRSNSSLELMHDHNHGHSESGHSGRGTSPLLRREYGSHGSIDVISSSSDRHGVSSSAGESFFAMLQDYRPAVLGLGTDQRSPGPAEYLRGKVEPPPSSENAANTLADEASMTERVTSPISTSPKLRLKFHRFWGSNNVANGNSKPPRPNTVDDSIVNTSTNNNISGEMDDRQRRRAFAHYDCQSLTANLCYAAKLRGLLLSRRRNTTTGASAASMLGTRSVTPDGGDSGDEDAGDGRSNDLIESCPFFRNEVGGEEERVVSLTRLHSSPKRRPTPIHRPPLSYGVSVLEFPASETHWNHGTCPYQRNQKTIENVDMGAQYYRNYFYNQEHQNWFGMDENLGPVAVSLKRERMERPSTGDNNSNSSPTPMFRYRVLIRTSELMTLRGSVLEDAIPNLKPSSSSKTINTKEVLEYVAPEIQLSCLRLGVTGHHTEEQLIKLDEQCLSSHYKVGIMYCRANQSTEEEMYNNQDPGPAFLEFLDTIGQKVRLKGFDKYKAGLDNKTDSTGLYSVYAQYQDCEIMFHVSTYLPFTPNNRQQLLRKRHIGNDIVTIVFQEPGAHPFTPKNIRSQFQHVFIVVRAVNPCTENTHYSVAVTRSKEVPVFGPPIPEGATFPKSKSFADFLLAKVINAENAAHRSEKFATMATRTRQEYLKDLVTNYSTSTLVESAQKFSMLSFSSKKKERWRPRFLPDATQRGAICWQVLLDDSSQATLVECFLAISADSLVLIEESSREIVFVTPCKSVLGWATQTNSLRVYYHQGECMTVHMREGGDRDELMEVVVRLRAVTSGSVAQELSLKRNPLGQLGFHVQPDGVVTQVESMGLAWQAGLRQGARLVEICKVAVSTLSHDQMVDLLKTSLLVTVTVIPPLSDGSPRRGCTLQNCKYTASNYEGDYENLSSPEEGKPNRKTGALQQAVPGNHRRRYERSFSPPRSSNSSGYGTGSSSKSFSTDSRFPSNPEGTMTSSSSGHSSDDRWYELLEPSLGGGGDLETGDSPPPPLPARLSAFSPAPASSNHSKLSASHSLPLPQNTGLSRFNESSSPQHEFKVGEKVTTCLLKASERSHELRRQLERSHDYHLVTRMPKVDYNGINHYHQQNNTTGEKSNSLPVECATASVRTLTLSDGHSTDTSSAASDRLFGAVSEDELSASSSPGIRRSGINGGSVGSSGGGTVGGGTPTPSSGSGSRNQSPRPRPDTGEARLRPGVTGRSSSSSRNSANLTSSTLQEDLMKLINPDYMSDDSLTPKENGVCGKVHSSSVGGEFSNRSRSRENLSGLSMPPQAPSPSSAVLTQGDKPPGEVILTLARPATVISNASTASSPAPSENKLSKEERLSPRVTKSSANKQQSSHDAGAIPLPGEMDWPSLVDTATRAMLQVGGDCPTGTSGSHNGENFGQWVDDVTETLGLDATSQLTSRRISEVELQKHLSQLKNQLSRETNRRISLENEVRGLREENSGLREENRRLQEESQNAAQQLRRFTEWFFQTIDKQ
ncbi:signal-induced proliferation-associated 1-like protein 2 [Lycorma delicatula]|uniref:signal-induced proliferation-associated 1-like protein 2 n=1 Tax=Lycorma delicatula TaxID=130591 RepID=UPI003F51A161